MNWYKKASEEVTIKSITQTVIRSIKNSITDGSFAEDYPSTRVFAKGEQTGFSAASNSLPNGVDEDFIVFLMSAENDKRLKYNFTGKGQSISVTGLKPEGGPIQIPEPGCEWVFVDIYNPKAKYIVIYVKLWYDFKDPEAAIAMIEARESELFAVIEHEIGHAEVSYDLPDGMNDKAQWLEWLNDQGEIKQIAKMFHKRAEEYGGNVEDMVKNFVYKTVKTAALANSTDWAWAPNSEEQQLIDKAVSLIMREVNELVQKS